MNRRQRIAHNIHILIGSRPRKPNYPEIALNCGLREETLRTILAMRCDTSDRVVADFARYFGVTADDITSEPVIDAGWKNLWPEV